MIAELRYKTGVDLDIEIDTWLVAALPDGQAITKIHENTTVVRVNKQGVIVNNLYTGSCIYGLLVQGSLFVLHDNGTIVQMQPEDGHILKVYNTGISGLRNYGSQHTDLCDIDQNILPLASHYLGNVYTYNISSQALQLRINNLNYPSSVTQGCVDGNVVYVVCERNAYKIHVYNETWSLVSSFGVYGVANGQLYNPHSAVISYQGYIFVTDSLNNRVSMFTSDGQFAKNILIYESEEKPRHLSVRDHYLWVTTSSGRLTRYTF